jgi:hypothetical protein
MPGKPADLSRPYTLPTYLSWLHRAVERLHLEASRLAELQSSGAPTDYWLAEHAVNGALFDVEEVIRAYMDVPRHPWPFRGGWSESEFQRGEDRIQRLVESLPSRAERAPSLPYQGVSEYVRRLASDSCRQTLRQVLELIPDPFDGPIGRHVALAEWAVDHLGLDRSAFDYEAPIPPGLERRFTEGFSVDRSPDEVREVRRTLLVEAGLIRRVEGVKLGPPAQPEVAPDPPNVRRDRRILELLRDQDLTVTQIRRQVYREIPTSRELGSDEGARKAACKRAIADGLPPPPERRRGCKPK